MTANKYYGISEYDAVIIRKFLSSLLVESVGNGTKINNQMIAKIITDLEAKRDD